MAGVIDPKRLENMKPFQEMDLTEDKDNFGKNRMMRVVGGWIHWRTIFDKSKNKDGKPCAIAGVFVPNAPKTEKRLKDEIEQIQKETQENIQGEVKVIKSKFVEIQKNMEEQIDKRARLNRAEFYSQMAISSSLDGKRKFGTFFFHIIAAIEYATFKRYESLTSELNTAISDSAGGIYPPSEISTAKIKEIAEHNQTIILEQVDEIRKILEEQGVEDRYSEQLAKVYEICKNMVIVADKPEPPEEPKQK